MRPALASIRCKAYYEPIGVAGGSSAEDISGGVHVAHAIGCHGKGAAEAFTGGSVVVRHPLQDSLRVVLDDGERYRFIAVSNLSGDDNVPPDVTGNSRSRVGASIIESDYLYGCTYCR